MKTIEYRNIDKSSWPRGPWDNEVDKKQWQDEATGLPCLIKRDARCGILCGYVGVTEGHPLFQQSYGTCDVHGGITYGGFCEAGDEATGICHLPEVDEPHKVWWLGFDCNHCDDATPKYFCAEKRYRTQGYVEREKRYRTQGYVERECRALARQLADMTERKESP